ncbi:holo-ACP synthase [uncultured Cetobacterium sp.]|uniref:holo-ACP synthase n=1 Tax=uncultured Cetobacterium sp. TaxID=527638 RepID=UPI0026141E57|nr:holo-ACP synthase [uncultured Cetobacterium sp.]
MGILGLGNDIVEISRIEKAILKKGFLEKVFTEKEIELIKSKGGRAESYAGRFSAKEAISKAFGTGVRGFKLTDIEILNDELGKPIVSLKGILKEREKKVKIELSISHCKEYATAVALVLERM